VLCNKLDEVLVKFDDAKNKGVRFNAAFYIDTLYDAIVNILCAGANAYVPRAKKEFFQILVDRGIRPTEARVHRFK